MFNKKPKRTFSQQVAAERKGLMDVFVQAKKGLVALNSKISGRRQDIKKEQLALKEEDKFLEQEYLSNEGSVHQLDTIISPQTKNAK